jgi:cytochrome c oxidase assembly protein subunit 15
MILIGLTVGLIALLMAVGAAEQLRKAAWLVLAAELAQGVVGFAQYFTGVPAPLVALHMLGACVLWIAVLHLALVAIGTSVRKIEPSPVVAS